MSALSESRSATNPAARWRRAQRLIAVIRACSHGTFLLVVGLALFAATACTARLADRPGAPPSNSTAVASMTPLVADETKPPTTFPPTASLAIGVRNCAAGDVSGTLHGWGPAGGTMYVAVTIVPTRGVCSIPDEPGVSAMDATGSRAFSVGLSSSAGQSRVAVPAQGILARVAVISWCAATRMAGLDVVIDSAANLTVHVELPSDFGVACTGHTSQLSVDQLVAP